jgi:WD40 repeat protein
MSKQEEPPDENRNVWPLFISYRRSDATNPFAVWLKHELESEKISASNGQVFSLDVFVDAVEAHQSDFQANLIPHLQHSRALIVLADAGACSRRIDGEPDYLYEELDWWAANRRKTPPIILQFDPESGARLVADPNFSGWSNVSRMDCFHVEWENSLDLGGSQKNLLLSWLRKSIRDYGQIIHLDEVLRLRRRALIAYVLLALALIATGIAWWQKEVANSRQRDAEASETAAINAERKTRNRSSKADADIAMELASSGDDARAFAFAVRAIELNDENTIARLLAYRLLTDGRMTLPEYLISQGNVATALAFSKNGSHLATGCDDGFIYVSDLVTGDIMHLKSPLNGLVKKIVFSPDGKTLAVATSSKLYTWEYSSSMAPTLVAKDFTNNNVLELSWPLVNRLVVQSGRDWGSDHRLTQVFGLNGQRWNLIFGVGDDLGIDDADLNEADIDKVVYIQHCKTWVAEQRGLLVVYDGAGEKLTWYDLALQPLCDPVCSMNLKENADVYVASDSGVAVVTYKENTTDTTEIGFAYQWVDPRTGENSGVQSEHGKSIFGVSADGERLLLRSLYGTALIDRRGGNLILEQKLSEEGDLTLITFKNDGNSWLLASSQPSRQSVAIYAEVFNKVHVREINLALPSKVAYLRSDFSSCQLGLAEFDTTGKWLAIASSDKNVRVWTLANLNQNTNSLRRQQTQLKPHEGYQSTVSGVYQLIEETIHRRNVKTGGMEPVCKLQECQEVKEIEETYGGGCCTGVAFSPDGQHLVVTYGSAGDRPDNNYPGVAVLYETTKGAIVGRPLRHDDDAFSPCFEPEGRWFVTASDDCTVRRWDSITGGDIGDPIRLPLRVRYLNVSPTGKLIVTGTGHIIDVDRWRVIREFIPPLRSIDEIEHAFFSPDGLWIASVSGLYYHNGDADDALEYTTLNQWDISTGMRIASRLETIGSPDFDWVKPGHSLGSEELVWQCVFPCSIPSILPLLKAFCSVRFDQAGMLEVNSECSLHVLSIEKLFPKGRTSENEPAYDLTRSILHCTGHVKH